MEIQVACKLLISQTFAGNVYHFWYFDPCWLGEKKLRETGEELFHGKGVFHGKAARRDKKMIF